MADPKLEQVFKKSGVPTYTFVRPSEYASLLVSLRTPGRGLVVEGPSGIGKSTSVTKALEELGVPTSGKMLSARKPEDRPKIEALVREVPVGTWIIDDFHKLDVGIRAGIADRLKTLADSEDPQRKIVVVGINKTGESLIGFGHDLAGRIDVVRFEANPPEKVLEVIEKGEAILNVKLSCKKQISDSSHGSFNITQMLCFEACMAGGVTERIDAEAPAELSVSFEKVQDVVLRDLSAVFFNIARDFAAGSKLRRSGRAPYLHILRLLAEAEEWSLQMDDAANQNPAQRASFIQVVEKNYLEKHMTAHDFSRALHYDATTHVLSAEDPKFVYYLRNLSWPKFARKVGFAGLDLPHPYDFALSFAGADRDIAKGLFDRLVQEEVAVFYDFNEQADLLAERVEDYLAPIYKSEAAFVIVLLGPDYPKKIWTKFESEQFKQRFADGEVIPIFFKQAPIGMFDKAAEVGGMPIDRDQPIDPQLDEIVRVLMKKLGKYRAS